MLNETSSGESWDGREDSYEVWRHWWWRDMELAAPRIPGLRSGDLMSHEQAGVWSTTHEYPPITVYGPFNLSDEFRKNVENNEISEFFMAGLAGHGINSWGLGIVASFDAYIVAIQVHFGGAYPTSYYRQRAVHMIGAWDTFVASAEATRAAFPAKRPKQPRWLIEFSDFRDQAVVMEREEYSLTEWGLAGWRSVFAEDDATDAGLGDFARGTDWPEERALAVGLLTSLEELSERAQHAPTRDGQDPLGG